MKDFLIGINRTINPLARLATFAAEKHWCHSAIGMAYHIASDNDFVSETTKKEWVKIAQREDKKADAFAWIFAISHLASPLTYVIMAIGIWAVI